MRTGNPERRQWLLLAVLSSLCAWAAGCSDPAPSGPVVAAQAKHEQGEVTFSRDVAPILFENCTTCHRPGEPGPFSLLSFEDAKQRARQIARVTTRRYMPPWLPAAGYGEFKGERGLTEDQIRTLQLWAAQGTPPGDPSQLPQLPHYSEGWQLGEPDLVLRLPQSYTLPSEGIDVFRNFVFDVPVDQIRYVRALEIRPFNKKVVHHANLLIDRTGLSRQRDAREPGMGFGGMDLEIESPTFEPQSHFLFWKPGTALSAGSDEMSWKVDPQTDLVLNIHMQPSGKPENIRPELGIHFSKRPPELYPMLLQLEGDGQLDIPPGEKNFVVTDELRMPVEVQVLAVYPHAHYLGKDLQAWAEMPDGTRQWLIWIPDWDLNWQAVYEYKQPLFLPQGTVLHMRYSYDNSTDNVRNPNNPPRRVRAGNQSTDEMSHLWVQVLPKRPEERKSLEEALMERRMVKYPQDPFAYANLGAVLQSEGRIEESIGYLQKALRLDPDDAVARNNLGAAFLATGRPGDALDQFERAVLSRPGYADALYNLGHALLSEGRLKEAEERFRGLLRSRPDDWGVHAGLAQALIGQGKTAQAVGHLKRAVELNPRNAELHNGLGSALAMQGDYFGALKLFEKAVQLEPELAEAQENLGQSLLVLRRFPEAIQHLEKAFQLRPQDADLCNDLGSAHATLGDLETAAHYFEQALKIDPDHASARQNLKLARQALDQRKP